MSSSIPVFRNKRKICIICEGDEEYDYIEKLISLRVWHSCYDITPINAEGNGNIPARYQDKYQNGAYEAIFVFCDTDKKPYEQYEDIKTKINEIHGQDNAADEVVIFGNPCTMQIIIMHWTDDILKSHKKKKNSPIIELCTGVSCYKARADQRTQIFNKINKENYSSMITRIEKLPKDDTIVGSSNFAILIENLTTADDNWIKELNKKLGGC